MFKVTAFCTDTCFQSFSPLINCIVHHAVLKFSPCRKKTLPQFVSIVDWYSIDALFQHAPDAVIYRVEVGLRSRLLAGHMSGLMRCLTAQKLNCVTSTMCWRIVLLEDKHVTFCVSRRRRKMYCDHARLCVCVCLSVCLSAAVRPHFCTDPDVTWGVVEAAP